MHWYATWFTRTCLQNCLEWNNQYKTSQCFILVLQSPASIPRLLHPLPVCVPNWKGYPFAMWPREMELISCPVLQWRVLINLALAIWISIHIYVKYIEVHQTLLSLFFPRVWKSSSDKRENWLWRENHESLLPKLLSSKMSLCMGLPGNMILFLS